MNALIICIMNMINFFLEIFNNIQYIRQICRCADVRLLFIINNNNNKKSCEPFYLKKNVQNMFWRWLSIILLVNIIVFFFVILFFRYKIRQKYLYIYIYINNHVITNLFGKALLIKSQSKIYKQRERTRIEKKNRIIFELSVYNK